MTFIASLQNQKIKNLVKLRQRRQRDQQKKLLIDGSRAVALALANAYPLEAIFVADSVAPARQGLLTAAEAQGAAIYTVSEAVFGKIGYGNTPDGLLALAPQQSLGLESLPVVEKPLYLITEGLEKPGNLGAILRSVDAAGLDGLIVCQNRTDIFNPNVIRASRGAFFSVKLACAENQTVLNWLKAQQIQILAATPSPHSQNYSHVDMTQPTALVLGAEHSGLSELWLAQTPIFIPMAGQVDSLNVAQAASVLMFEAVRQRGG